MSPRASRHVTRMVRSGSSSRATRIAAPRRGRDAIAETTACQYLVLMPHYLEADGGVNIHSDVDVAKGLDGALHNEPRACRRRPVARNALPSRYVQPARSKFLVRTYSSNGEKKSVMSGPTPACDVPQRCRRPAPRYVQT